jgi:hypothetical protein
MASHYSNFTLRHSSCSIRQSYMYHTNLSHLNYRINVPGNLVKSPRLKDPVLQTEAVLRGHPVQTPSASFTTSRTSTAIHTFLHPKTTTHQNKSNKNTEYANHHTHPPQRTTHTPARAPRIATTRRVVTHGNSPSSSSSAEVDDNERKNDEEVLCWIHHGSKSQEYA